MNNSYVTIVDYLPDHRIALLSYSGKPELHLFDFKSTSAPMKIEDPENLLTTSEIFMSRVFTRLVGNDSTMVWQVII